jgi:YgiT-type zinc finger domain-containing protein
MKCPICEKGTLKNKIVDVVRHGIFIGHFKADVCSHCGEQIFDSRVVSSIHAKMVDLGMFGSEKATVYKVGGSFAIALKSSLSKALGITKSSKPTVYAQLKEKRLIVELG